MLLEVEDLSVEFRTSDGVIRAVDHVSFQLTPGETLGIVGESGSGKSVTSLALLGLIQKGAGRGVTGRALFNGVDLLRLSEDKLSHIRGNRIAMIFQDPMTSLNPYLTVAEQLTEVTRRHLGFTYKRALDHAVEWLTKVGIPAPGKRIHDYPHRFSGGMRQRVMIAMALACKPDVLIADEPTTALDVTIQAQILELMRSLQQSEGIAILFITHDLGVVAGMCHRVNVMYAGSFVEEAPVDQLFSAPRHPYTLGLLASLPSTLTTAGGRLTSIAGQPPVLGAVDGRCAFAPRCPYVFDRCLIERPRLFPTAVGSRAACFADVTAARSGQPIDISGST